VLGKRRNCTYIIQVAYCVLTLNSVDSVNSLNLRNYKLLRLRFAISVAPYRVTIMQHKPYSCLTSRPRSMEYCQMHTSDVCLFLFLGNPIFTTLVKSGCKWK